MPKSDGWKNLKPMSERTPEERRKYGSIGGKKNGETMERRRNMQECMRALLEITTSKDKAREKLGDIADLASENPTLMELVGLAQLREAQDGNTKAAEFVRDTAGYKPVERQEINAEIMSEADRALMEQIAQRIGLNPAGDGKKS
jgi:hypothetical protein